MFGVLIVGLLFSSPKVFAEGATVLVQAPGSARLDYRAMLKAHADFVSPTEDYLNRHPLPAARELLLNAFAEAQRAFLEKSPGEAKAKFNDVLAMRLSEDWNNADREIFLHAYLRLAQLEENESRRTQVLRESLALDEDVSFDQSLFPPPLVEQRASLRGQTNFVYVDLGALKGEFHKILLNGRVCEDFRCGPLPDLTEKVRVTYLSDLHPPHSEILSPRDLSHTRPKLDNWVHGRCQQAEWSMPAELFVKKRAFWSLECDSPKLIAKNLSVTPVFQDHKASSAFDVALASEPAKPVPFFENKWVWIGSGVGAAVLAAVIWSQNSRHSSPSHSATTTYGY